MKFATNAMGVPTYVVKTMLCPETEQLPSAKEMDSVVSAIASSMIYGVVTWAIRDIVHQVQVRGEKGGLKKQTNRNRQLYSLCCGEAD